MKRVLSGGVLVAFLIAMSGIFSAEKALAAQLTAKSDTMSRLQDNTASNHTIQFTTPTGVTTTQTMTFTFPAAFDTASIVEDDVDVKDDAVELTTAADCNSTEQASVVMSADVLTVTICSDYAGGISAGSVVNIEIGTNATSSGTGARQITNPDIGSNTTYEIAIGGSMADSGQLEVQIIMDDTVNVTATVDESISFSITDLDVGFGDLNSGSARYATGTTGSDSETSAHDLTVSTNASGGWAITYDNDQSLKSGSDEIDEATFTGDPNGTPGSEQFAMSFTRSGDCTVETPYANASDNWKYEDNPAAPVRIAYETVPSATETIAAFYIANISSLTPSGAYSTNITYIATATF